MKILVIADIHGYEKELGKILKEPHNIDLIVCLGDFIDIFKTPEGFPPIDMADMILQKLVALNKPMLCIPGNHDPQEITQLLEDYGVNLHDKMKKFKGTTFVGFGGAETPFNTPFEPTEQEIEKSLSKHNPPKNFILVVHQPPRNTKQDLTSSGQHVGSSVIKNYIVNKKPILVLTGHIHEAEGIDHIGPSVIFNPGPVFEGKYGIVEITDSKVTCKTRSTKV